jgi:hypothetical protein
MWHAWELSGMHARFWSENQKEIGHYEDVGKKIILK